MSDNVVDLKARRDQRALIWVCNCGCTVHRHHVDGRVECAECENIASVSDDGWRELLPETPAEAKPLPDDAFHTVRLDDIATFFRRRLKDEPAPVAAICVYVDGSAATFLEHGRLTGDELTAAFNKHLARMVASEERR